ncbi:MAG: hypothetical protein ACJ73D_02680 [Pyrinomonadaceae bacterium]
MLLTIGLLILAGILLIVALITKRAWLAKFTTLGVAVWLMSYAIMLVGFSLVSKDRVLGIGEAKAYCGFYLDCHMHTEVTSVRTAKTVGDRQAQGTFYIVGVRVFTDARNPNIAFRLLEPNAKVIVTDDSVIGRDLAAEAALPTAAVDLGADIKGRQTNDKEIVFDVPDDLINPKLHIAEGYGIDNVIEAVLIDDEDSILHGRTYFSLTERRDIAGGK